MGLAAVALSEMTCILIVKGLTDDAFYCSATNPSFPGYPAPLTAAQVAAGLPAPAAASAILGQTGAILMLVLLFLAVTSAASAELVAVSSIITCERLLYALNPTD